MLTQYLEGALDLNDSVFFKAGTLVKRIHVYVHAIIRDRGVRQSQDEFLTTHLRLFLHKRTQCCTSPVTAETWSRRRCPIKVQHAKDRSYGQENPRQF